ncbi:MAG: hypothetical protein V1779_06215 [bacterium]
MKNPFIILFLLFYMQSQSYSQELIWNEQVNLTLLNTRSDDFAPVWNRFQEQLYFNSCVSGFSKFYHSIPDANFNFLDYKLVEGEINLPRSNQSYITFETNDISYISSYRQYPGRSYMNIFQTRKKKNTWLKPFGVDSLIYPLFMAQATVSPDGTMLIFTTTLNSEFGDTDLWMSFKQENGTWGSLMLITSLKTPGNEITPFLASNDTLYFASDGQEGPGGYDLFMSIRKDGIWQIPFPLSSLNTEFDESDFTILPNNKAIFASNRPGGVGGLDLYLTSLGKEKIMESDISSIDFSIAAQVPAIKIIGDITEEITPLFNYYYFYKNDILNPGFKFKENLTANNPDSIHLFSPMAISERIRNMKEHNLFITIFFNDINESEQENIRNKLINLLGLPEERMSVRFIPMNENQKADIDENINYIKFTTNNEKVYSPIDISNYKMEVIPPALELSLDARPRTLVKQWECKLSIGTSPEKAIKFDNQLPANFFHEIKIYSKELINSDSLVISVTVVDTLNRKHEFKQVFNVTHSNSTQDKFVIYKNKKYIEYYILLPDIRELREGNTFLNTFRTIAEKALENKSIVIRSYSDYGKNMASGIKEYIAEQIGGNDIVVKIDPEIIKDKYSKKPYGKYLFSILVEIL